MIFAGQGAGQTDGHRGDYMLHPFGSIINQLWLTTIEHTYARQSCILEARPEHCMIG